MSAAPVTDLRTHLAALFESALDAFAPEARGTAVTLERPKQASHGDYACNLALQLSRQLRRNPREIATALIQSLPESPYVARTEIAGAGFINIFLQPAAKRDVVRRIFAAGERYGHSTLGQDRRVQVEFVSANPTGPLHVGHGRGAAYGSVLSNLLAASGFEVTREFYVNDAGRQMDILALSVWLRYLHACGQESAFPADGYRGDYVRDIAAQLAGAHGDRLVHPAAALPAAAAGEDADAALDALIGAAKTTLGEDWWTVHRFALDAMLADQRSDLGEFRVHYDVWYSEQSLHTSGAVERALQRLQDGGHLYVQDGALWFRSTTFGDEKDRVVRRDNGAYTYFASDIAYHAEKFDRGFDVVIDVWGADHHGYIPRVKGALQALGYDPARLEVALVQFAVLFRGGEKVAMGKRSGDFVTLRELREEVGNDAARFFYVLRKSDQHLDFDLDLAKSQSNDNPVYYIQYAHARVCSVLQGWGGDEAGLAAAALDCLDSVAEMQLLQLLIDYPETIEAAARDFAPHAVAFHLKDIAAAFHSWYNGTRFLVEDVAARDARLALAVATRNVLRAGLALLGVTAPDKM